MTIGNAEDGTQNTSVVKIIQLGYESDIDTVATNYKGYFKSMDGVLYSVAFITNPNYDSYGENIHFTFSNSASQIFIYLP